MNDVRIFILFYFFYLEEKIVCANGKYCAVLSTIDLQEVFLFVRVGFTNSSVPDGVGGYTVYSFGHIPHLHRQSPSSAFKTRTS